MYLFTTGGVPRSIFVAWIITYKFSLHIVTADILYPPSYIPLSTHLISLSPLIYGSVPLFYLSSDPSFISFPISIFPFHSPFWPIFLSPSFYYPFPHPFIIPLPTHPSIIPLPSPFYPSPPSIIPPPSPYIIPLPTPLLSLSPLYYPTTQPLCYPSLHPSSIPLPTPILSLYTQPLFPPLPARRAFLQSCLAPLHFSQIGFVTCIFQSSHVQIVHFAECKQIY